MFFLQFIAGLIGAAQARGEIRSDIVPQQNARILIAAVQGLAFRWILSDNRFDLAEQADAVITTLIEGWAPRVPAVAPTAPTDHAQTSRPPFMR